MRSVKQRAITSAATQVTIKSFFNIVCRGVRVVAQQSIQAHHNAGSTETALTAVTLCDSFLDRVRPLHGPNTFDSNDMLAVDADEWSQTCVDRGMIDPLCCRIELRHNLGSNQR